VTGRGSAVPQQRRGDERLHVAQVVTRFQAGAGGVALRGAAALDPARYRVTVMAGSGDRLLEEARDLGMEVLLVPDLVPPISPARDRAALAALTALLRARRPDVVHTHSAKAGALGRLAASRAGTPRVVHTFHGFPFHEFQSRPRRGVYVTLERRLGRLTDAFLAVGTGVAVEAIRRGIARPDAIRTIGAAVAAVPVVPTAQARSTARALLGLPDGVPVIGTVGRLDFQKAPEHLVQALALLRHRDALVVWIGDGPLRADVEREIARHGLQDRFRLAGERADVARLLPALDVFALPSRYEGLPCADVEAQACGVPVVATAVNAVPDVVVPGETGLLVPPGRPALLARALDHLLAEPELAHRMGAEGRDRLGVRFDPDTLGRVLEQSYGGRPAALADRPGARR
jgi:glycosyltransferase involved in cell wall biosynthesis